MFPTTLDPFRLMVEAGAGAAGFGAEEGVEIDGENVGLNYLDVGREGEVHAQLGGQNPVGFDGDEAARPAGQEGGQGAAAGPDFEHGALRNVPERFGDALGGANGSTRKCCPSLGFRAGASG